MALAVYRVRTSWVYHAVLLLTLRSSCSSKPSDLNAMRLRKRRVIAAIWVVAGSALIGSLIRGTTLGLVACGRPRWLLCHLSLLVGLVCGPLARSSTSANGCALPGFLDRVFAVSTR